MKVLKSIRIKSLMDIGALLREVRGRRTQRDLAQRSRVHAVTICRVEAGADLNVSTLLRLLDALDLALYVGPADGLPQADASREAATHTP